MDISQVVIIVIGFVTVALGGGFLLGRTIRLKKELSSEEENRPKFAYKPATALLEDVTKQAAKNEKAFYKFPSTYLVEFTPFAFATCQLPDVSEPLQIRVLFFQIRRHKWRDNDLTNHYCLATTFQISFHNPNTQALHPSIRIAYVSSDKIWSIQTAVGFSIAGKESKIVSFSNTQGDHQYKEHFEGWFNEQFPNFWLSRLGELNIFVDLYVSHNSLDRRKLELPPIVFQLKAMNNILETVTN
jgi:hypothetical protein